MNHLRMSLTGVLLLAAPSGLIEAGPPNGTPTRSVETRTVSGELVWTWKQIDKSNRYALYVNQINIAVYDHDAGTYHRVNSDGTLSAPSTPPWEVMKQLQQATPPPVKEPLPEPAPEEAAEEPEEESPTYYDLYFKDSPPWLPYTIGGLITLLICGVGLIVNARRS